MSTKNFTSYIFMSAMIVLFLGVAGAAHGAAKKTKQPLGAACTKSTACTSGSCANKHCVQYIEWDAVNNGNGDAPNSSALAQTAEPLKPGKYGAREVKLWTFGVNRISSKKDFDFYKVIQHRGTMIEFTVTPSKAQDIQVEYFNDNGKFIVKSNGSSKYKDVKITKTGRAGSAESITLYNGIETTKTTDTPITGYFAILGTPGTYTITIKETEMKDAEMPDASAAVANATKIAYNTIFNGYIGLGDNRDCYEIDPTPAVGKELTLLVNPVESTTNITLDDFYSANGTEVTPDDLDVGLQFNDVIYKKRDGKLKNTLSHGAAGFAEKLVVFPYYAMGYGSMGTAELFHEKSTLFTYFCITKKVSGHYTLSVTYK